MDHPPTTPYSTHHDPGLPARQLMFIAELLLALVVPVTVIRLYWRQMRLLSAFVVHVFGVVIGALGLALIVLAVNIASAGLYLVMINRAVSAARWANA